MEKPCRGLNLINVILTELLYLNELILYNKIKYLPKHLQNNKHIYVI